MAKDGKPPIEHIRRINNPHHLVTGDAQFQTIMSQEKKGYEMKEGQVSVFINDKEGNEKRPDYTGKALLNGKEYRVSFWKENSASGMTYLSGTIQPPRNSEQDKAGFP